MQIALIADPHVSLLRQPHGEMNLGDTVRMTEAIVADIQCRQPDLVIWLGDLTHENTPVARQQFSQLQSRLTLPSLHLLGNHDVEQIDKAGFAREVVPCLRRQWWQMAGWDLVVLDTVQELSPHDPNGVLGAGDLRFLEEVAGESAGRLLVMGHHPLRLPYMNPQPFWAAIRSFAGTGVYIGGHSHLNFHQPPDVLPAQVAGTWHTLEVSSCCVPPAGYHLLSLSEKSLTIEEIVLQLPDRVEGGLTGKNLNVYPIQIEARHPVA